MKRQTKVISDTLMQNRSKVKDDLNIEWNKNFTVKSFMNVYMYV